MALQGTLETFELPDVLRLLSSTKKTGMLELDGDRGVGRVWLADGDIVSGSSDREAGAIEAVLFDLLRTTDGSFVFESCSVPDHTGDRTDVGTALDAAQALLDDWRTIASVVPSLDVDVRLVADLGADSIEVDADQWRVLALVGSGSTGHRLDSHLELGELECCRRLADMVESGMIEIEPIDSSAEPTEVVFGPAPEPVFSWESEPPLVDHDLSTDEVASLGADLASFVSHPVAAAFTLPERDAETDVSSEAVSSDRESLDRESFDPESFERDSVDTEPGPYEAGDVDPEPVEAASFQTETAADDGVGDDQADLLGDALSSGGVEALGDDELNRNLLLKFLSSTKN